MRTIEKEHNSHNDAFDVLKFALSLGIVAIHTMCPSQWLWPILRMAVPLFFIMTAYFFFRSREKHENAVARFVKRNLTLYGFWFVVQFPVVLYLRGYHTEGILRGALYLVRDFFFGSTFGASWYIMASVIAIVIISGLSKRLNNRLLLAFTTLVYLGCCLVSNYYGLVEHRPAAAVYDFLYRNLGEPYNAFPVALFWCVIGKVLAERPGRVRLAGLLPMLLISLVLLFAEDQLIAYLGCCEANDCYLLLPLACVSVFLLVRDYAQLRCRAAAFFRRTSTIMYVTHISVSIVVGFVGRRVIPSFSDGMLYALTVAVCVFISVLLHRASSRRHLEWLCCAW